MSWEKAKLGDLITESRIPSENPDPNKRITVRLKVLGVEKRGLENEIAGATKQFIRKSGQFIYGKQNFHKGAFGIIPNELDGFETSADLPAFDVNEKCTPEWIFYFFKQGGFYLELAKMARGVATQRIHPAQLYDLEIPLPDLENQIEIISKIKNIEKRADNLSSELSFQLTQLENLNQAILQEAVQGKLVAQNPDDEPASELLKRIKAEKALSGKKHPPAGRAGKALQAIKPEFLPAGKAGIPFDIPESWVWCRLGEICESSFYGPRFSNSDYTLTGIPTIRTTDMTDSGEIILKDTPRVWIDDEKKLDLYKVIDGDLLVTRSGSIGIMAIFRGNYLAIPSAYLIRFRFCSNVLPEYIFSLLKSPFWQALMGLSSTATAQVNINATNILQFPIPLPPLSEQKRIVAEIEKQLAKTKQLKEHVIANQQATEQLLKALLHQAFEQKEKDKNLAKA